LDERMTRVESALENIERIVHGPPPLEDRLRDYAERVAGHKANNAKQDALDVRHELELAEARRDVQHADNQHQSRQLFRLVYIGVGILMALNAVAVTMLALILKR